MPAPVVAVVQTIGGRQLVLPPSSSIPSRSRTVSDAPGRSALLTTNTSAISSKPGLRGLHRVAPTGIHDDDRRVGVAGDLDLDLPDADGLDEDPRRADRVEHARGLRRRDREAAEVAAGRHRADEHAGVGRVVLHADAVAEDRAAAERAGRVDGEHADRRVLGADRRDEAVGERRLPRARRAGDADRPGVAGVRVQRGDDRARVVAAVFDERDQLGDRAPVTGARAFDQLGRRCGRMRSEASARGESYSSATTSVTPGRGP